MRESEKGFSLVELSIVFVIIGLLIGGILAAQSMIQTTKIQALVKQVGQFDAAVENFQTKFGQLPGDNTIMGNWHGSNNNDGMISEYRAGNPNQYFGNELARFWSDLSIGVGLMGPNGTPYIDGSNLNSFQPDSTYAPQPALPGHSTNTSNPPLVLVMGQTVGYNYYLMTAIGQPNNLLAQLYPIFKPVDVLAIDQKIDDGLANSGNVTGWDYGASGYGGPGVTSQTTGTSCSTVAGGTAYATSNTGYTCSLRIRLGTSTGDLK